MAMGLSRVALRDANVLIDMPDVWFRERGLENTWGLKHDDDRKFAMIIVRSILADLHGSTGVLSADLHYALDYIERWHDPKQSAWMLEGIRKHNLYPPKRYGFVHRYKRLWYPSYREGTIPITAYCTMCNGVEKPIGSPFCNECHVHLVREERLPSKINFKFFLQMLAKKLEEREIDLKVVEFIGRNLNHIIDMIIEDRENRGLNSVKIIF